jgi:lipopolysaccharide/colanic/teichoic acid biosynthesis glycosyltransferase
MEQICRRVEMKRIFDFVISLLALIILFPIFIIISLIIIVSSKGGVFFRGERVGKNGKIFKIFKFRSMLKDSEGNGKWNVGNNDPRVTKIGIFLRKSKLDELPQLINVLKGEMSLVGPRPELKYYIDKYTDEEMPILDLKPGITDWASMVNISQFEVFTKADDPDLAYEKYIRPVKLKLQLFYRYNNSFVGDLQILIWTVIKVITRTEKLPKKVELIINEK